LLGISQIGFTFLVCRYLEDQEFWFWIAQAQKELGSFYAVFVVVGYLST
jgi:hypothetical protein